MSASGLLLVLTAPSGTGKSSLLRALLAKEAGLRFSVSHTTRPARTGETDGVDYHFVDREMFERIRDQGGFVEWAEVHGRLYGTSHAEIQTALTGPAEVLLDIDVQGARQLVARYPRAVTVFLLPPNLATLEARLRGRGTETEANVRARLRAAAREVRQYAAFQYLVVNDAIDRATEELRAIVAAERARTARRLAVADRIVASFPDPGAVEGA